MSHDRNVKICEWCGKQLWDGAICDCHSYVAQEGGDHYQAEYQHWDWVIDCQIHYLAANCTKYISRWRKKNGVQDLRKAMTYLDKMIVTKKRKPDYVFNHGTGYTVRVCTDRIVETLGLVGAERSIFELLSGPCPIAMLDLAKEKLRGLIWNAQRAQEHGFDLNAPNPYCPPPMPSDACKKDVPGRAGCMVGQGAASNASRTLVKKPSTGMEYPFGYDASEEI